MRAQNDLLQSCNNGVASNWTSRGPSEVAEARRGWGGRQTWSLFANEGCEIQKTSVLFPFLRQIRKWRDSSRLGGCMLVQTKPCLSNCLCFLSCWTVSTGLLKCCLSACSAPMQTAACAVCSLSVFSTIRAHQQGPNSNPHQMWTAPKLKTHTPNGHTGAQMHKQVQDSQSGI